MSKLKIYFLFNKLFFQWMAWPDHGAPEEKDYSLVKYFIDLCLEKCDKGMKFIIHCSAGVGRTGTLITLLNIYYTLRYF